MLTQLTLVYLIILVCIGYAIYWLLTSKKNSVWIYTGIVVVGLVGFPFVIAEYVFSMSRLLANFSLLSTDVMSTNRNPLIFGVIASMAAIGPLLTFYVLSNALRELWRQDGIKSKPIRILKWPFFFAIAISTMIAFGHTDLIVPKFDDVAINKLVERGNELVTMIDTHHSETGEYPDNWDDFVPEKLESKVIPSPIPGDTGWYWYGKSKLFGGDLYGDFAYEISISVSAHTKFSPSGYFLVYRPVEQYYERKYERPIKRYGNWVVMERTPRRHNESDNEITGPGI
jgi:hypothetical protein